MPNVTDKTEPDKVREALRHLVTAAELLAEQPPKQTQEDPWVDFKTLESEGWSRESLRSAADKGLKIFRGPRRKILVRRSEVDRWIESRPWKPGTRKPKPVGSLEEAHEETARSLGVVR